MDEDEKNYVESEDEDFNPETIADAEEDLSSSSGDEDGETTARKVKKSVRKRKIVHDQDLDSGDEVTIKEATRKKRRKNKEDEDGSGGEGGLIKTRAQRAAAKEEKQSYRKRHEEEITIDVDSLWLELSSAPIGRPQKDTPIADQLKAETVQDDITNNQQDGGVLQDVPVQGNNDADEFITIKRTYEFAGQTICEEKRVHRDSAEAKLFLTKGMDEQLDKPTVRIRDDGVTLRRPLKRSSMFEPNPTGEVKGLPLHKQRLRTPSRADALALQKRTEEEAKANGGKTQRLNTVQKSAIDWASHVDAEGLKDELEEYDKSKQGYMSKMDFLQGVQGRRDDDERHARLAKV